MSERFYPPITEEAAWSLQIILEHLETDPTYLDDPDCPYRHDFREILTRITPKQRVLDVNPDEINLESEAHNLFLELRESKDHLNTEDNAERMSYFRTATSLLDKLIGLRERANNVKRVSAFYSTVLQVMEEVLEPGQITQVRERLHDFL